MERRSVMMLPVPGRAGLFVCASLLLTLHVCLASFTVNVEPQVDVIKDETASLPCKFTTTELSGMTLVQWFIESAGIRKRVAYRSSKDAGLDKDTPFTGRTKMEDDNTLVISSVMVSDERSFYCQVTGGAMGASEGETKLRVFDDPEKPVISGNSHPITVSLEHSHAAEVGTCTSRNGHPEPRIIWFKDNKPLPAVTDSKEPTYIIPQVVKEASGLFTITSTLFIRPVKEDAKASFHCTVEFRMPREQIEQESSESFKLQLLYPAENAIFSLVENTGPIKEGDDVEMKCETDGNPQPTFDFMKGDKILHNGAGMLTLHKVTRSDTGAYRCIANDYETQTPDNLTKVLNLTVHYLDNVTLVPSGPLEVAKGNALELQCQTKTADQYTLMWMKDGKERTQNGVLSIPSVTMADAGTYKCVASVPSVPGLQKHGNISVTVLGKPEIVEPEPKKVAKQGQMVTLQCMALGHPAPQFTWKPSGKESMKVDGNKYINKIELEASAAVLKDGVTCEATNSYGMDSKKFTVEIASDNAIGSNVERAESQQGGSGGVVIAVVVCVLLLLLLVASLFFLSKRNTFCKKGKKQLEPKEDSKDTKGDQKNPNEETGLVQP